MFSNKYKRRDAWRCVENLAGWHPAFCCCFTAAQSTCQHTVYSSKAGSLSLRCMIRQTSWMSFLISQTVVWNKTNSSSSISHANVLCRDNRARLPPCSSYPVTCLCFAPPPVGLAGVVWVKLGGFSQS